jgi:hypothetical protein
LRILKTKELKEYRENKIPKHGVYIDPIVFEQTNNLVVDHDHKTGFIREVIDREINQYIGKCEQNFVRFIHWKFPSITLPNLLRNIANYLDKDYTNNPYHPNHAKKMQNKFKVLRKEMQDQILQNAGIEAQKTKELNLKEYKKIIKSGKSL